MKSPTPLNQAMLKMADYLYQMPMTMVLRLRTRTKSRTRMMTFMMSKKITMTGVPLIVLVNLSI
jgi:hypothetical protein